MAAPKTKRVTELSDPSAFTPVVLSKLEDSFSKGLTITMACLQSGVSQASFFRIIKEKPELGERFRALRENVKLHSLLNVAKEIIEEKDVETSKWYLERRDKDFKPKQEVENTGEVGLYVTNRQYADIIRREARIIETSIEEESDQLLPSNGSELPEQLASRSDSEQTPGSVPEGTTEQTSESNH